MFHVDGTPLRPANDHGAVNSAALTSQSVLNDQNALSSLSVVAPLPSFPLDHHINSAPGREFIDRPPYSHCPSTATFSVGGGEITYVATVAASLAAADGYSDWHAPLMPVGRQN